MTAPRVVVVDSGMRSLGGHNFSYTQAVRDAFARRGARVDVLVNRGLPAEIAAPSGFHPVFSCGAYDHPLGHGRLRDFVYLRAQSYVFAEELSHGLRCVLRADPELVFCHTVADFELLGWVRFLKRAPLRGALAVLIRHTPGFASAGWARRRLNPYWRLMPSVFAKLRARLGPRFLLCTDSGSLSEDYARVYGGRIVTLPIPIGADPDAAPAGGAAAPAWRAALQDAYLPRVGYLGDARAGKGFPLLPGLVERVAEQAPAHFVIQCPAAAGGDDRAAPPPGLAELQRLAADARHRVTLIPDKLTTADYAELLRHLDVVVLPYQHDVYRHATSGIFAEALAFALPVVVPSETWMARELERSGAGAVFARGDEQQLARAVLEVLRDYPRLLERARAGRDAWRAFHNPGTLADLLFREAGLSGVPARGGC